MQQVAPPGTRWWFAAVLLAAGSQAAAQVTTRGDTVGRLLNLWFNEGSAAGLARLTYENRDGGHSRLNTAEWPQLRVYEPSGEDRKLGAAPGAAAAVRPFALIGNASMAAPADKGGSIPRLYETSPDGVAFLAKQYFNNNLFFYPSHQDHNAGWNGVGGWGDLYPTNIPCVVISQGSSGTDQPFLRAFISAAAAFQPDIQRRLVSTHMLAPTLQALFRQSNRTVHTQQDYFTGAAHPPVFRGADIDEERFVRAAHNLTMFAIPPVVVLNVRSETPAVRNGRDYFEIPAIASEAIADTPCVVARVFRGGAFRREMTVSARRSYDVNRHPLEFRWALLQGDARRVKIAPSADGTTAGITVAWHPEIRSSAGLASHRVDIGVFATNGLTWSSPAFITFYMLPNEMRQYRHDGRLEEICYERGNPDPGLPPSGDLRWLSLGRKLAAGGRTFAGKLLHETLPDAAANILIRAANELAGKQEHWRELSAEAREKPEADAALRELEVDVLQRVESRMKDGTTVRSAVEKAMFAIAERPDLLIGNQDAIATAVKNSGTTADFAVAMERVMAFRLIAVSGHGRCMLWRGRGELSAGDVALLRDFHLTLMALALYPEFLDRSNKPEFTDSRLTTPKVWRDLHHDDAQGRPAGWTRITDGREFEFDAEGRLLPDGRGGPAVEVRYSRNDATGLLLFAPK